MPKRTAVVSCTCLILLSVMFTTLFVVGSVTAQTIPRPLAQQEILILTGPQYGLPTLEAITPTIVNSLTANGFGLDDIHVEFLDLHRHPSPQHRVNILALLTYKLKNRSIGLIIAINQGAVDFVARDGQQLFPDAPMLIPILEKLPVWEGKPRKLITIESRQDAEGTLRHALNLFPDTKRVLLITGKDDQKAPFLSAILNALDSHSTKLQIQTTADIAYETMLEQVSKLSKDSIVFYGSYFNDVTGRSFVPAEVASQVATAANRPVFAFRDTHIFRGLVGGSVTITSDLGKEAARISREYLAGNLILAQPVTSFHVTNKPLFDWRQLNRWDGKIKALPADTIFLNRPPTLWSQHKEAVIVAVACFFILLVLVAALFIMNSRQRTAIRHRKQAEEELAAEATRRRILIEQSKDGIVILDQFGNVFESNKRFADMIGYPLELMHERHVMDWEFQHPREQVMEMIRSVDEKGDNFESKHRRRDGSIYDVEISINAAWFKGQKLIFCVCRDITERKQGESALREAHDRLAKIVATTPGFVFSFRLRPDGSTCFPFGGERIAEQCDIPQARLDEDAEPFMALIHPDDLDRVRKSIAESACHLIPWRQELRILHPVEGELWIESHSMPLTEPDGSILWHGVTTDITVRKQAENERERLQAQLLQSQKMESVGRLAGGVAHDFNNMLGVILGHTELALGKTAPDQEIYSHLEEVRKAADRSADLTRQLLAFARKQPVAPRILDLNETVTGMLNLLRRLIGENIELVWKAGENLWPVNIDPSQVDQILTNLCANARDSIANVGTVGIETANKTLDEAYCTAEAEMRPGDYVLIAVTDNGCGMHKSVLDNLFEPFFTTKADGKGTGLGLATVYGIVKQNGGFIHVYSEPDRGSIFSIYLPRHQATAGPLSLTPPHSNEKQGNETILLVEDEPAILMMTSMMLERLGYTVIAANRPDSAIQVATEHHADIHLMITDVIMPAMTGPELAERIQLPCPGIKCLFMSGYTADIIGHHGVLTEGIHFIQKPFTMKELATKIRAALDSN